MGTKISPITWNELNHANNIEELAQKLDKSTEEKIGNLSEALPKNSDDHQQTIAKIIYFLSTKNTYHLSPTGLKNFFTIIKVYQTQHSKHNETEWHSLVYSCAKAIVGIIKRIFTHLFFKKVIDFPDYLVSLNRRTLLRLCQESIDNNKENLAYEILKMIDEIDPRDKDSQKELLSKAIKKGYWQVAEKILHLGTPQVQIDMLINAINADMPEIAKKLAKKLVKNTPQVRFPIFLKSIQQGMPAVAEILINKIDFQKINENEFLDSLLESIDHGFEKLAIQLLHHAVQKRDDQAPDETLILHVFKNCQLFFIQAINQRMNELIKTFFDLYLPNANLKDKDDYLINVCNLVISNFPEESKKLTIQSLIELMDLSDISFEDGKELKKFISELYVNYPTLFFLIYKKIWRTVPKWAVEMLDKLLDFMARGDFLNEKENFTDILNEIVEELPQSIETVKEKINLFIKNEQIFELVCLLISLPSEILEKHVEEDEIIQVLKYIEEESKILTLKQLQKLGGIFWDLVNYKIEIDDEEITVNSLILTHKFFKQEVKPGLLKKANQILCFNTLNLSGLNEDDLMKLKYLIKNFNICFHLDKQSFSQFLKHPCKLESQKRLKCFDALLKLNWQELENLLSYLPNIKSIEIDTSLFQQNLEAWKLISQLPTLKSVYLVCKEHHEVPPILTSSLKGYNFYLKKTQQLEFDEIISLVQSLPRSRIKGIDLSNRSTPISKEQWEQLLLNLPQIRVINLKNCSFYDNECIFDLTFYCPHLKGINLKENNTISPKIIFKFLKQNPQLKNVILQTVDNFD